MKKQTTPVQGEQPKTKLLNFTAQQLTADQQKQVKGGDGEDPPAEEGIGHEDILDL